MVSGFIGGHAEAYRATLLDRKDVPIRRLNMLSGKLDWNSFRVIPGGGEITIDPRQLGNVNWLTDRVGVSYHARFGTQVIDKQLMICTVSGVSEQRNVTVLQLLDKCSVLESAGLERTTSYSAGTVVTTLVRTLLQSVGENKIAIPVSTETLRTTQVFEGGTSILTVINALLTTIGYRQLWVDGEGVFRSDKDIDVDRRLPVYNFSEGGHSIHSEEIGDDLDLLDIPNMIVVVGMSDGATTSLFASARNDDPDDPYSIPNRGVHLRKVEGVEASSQSVLQGIANNYLNTSSQVTWRQTLRHLWLDLALDDAVVSPNGKQFNVVEMAQELTPGALSSTVIRRMDRLFSLDDK